MRNQIVRPHQGRRWVVEGIIREAKETDLSKGQAEFKF